MFKKDARIYKNIFFIVVPSRKDENTRICYINRDAESEGRYCHRQRCQPGTTPICKIMTKHPYNLLKKSLQIVNTIAKHNFGIGSRCKTPIYNTQTKHNL